MRPAPGDPPAVVAMLDARRAYYDALDAELDVIAKAEKRLVKLRQRRAVAEAEYRRATAELVAERNASAT
jgi:hypothetical protein